MKAVFAAITIFLAGAAVYFYGFSEPKVIPVVREGVIMAGEDAPAEEAPVRASSTTVPKTLPVGGFAPVKLANPPENALGKYFSAWSAGSARRMDPFMAGAESEGINSVVLDIKDYSGYVSYKMDVPEVSSSGADRELRIGNVDELVQKLHDRNIYVIARVTVFQDPIFAKAHPELALGDKTHGGLWRDRKGLAWLDPAGQKTWDYAVAIANDAFAHGFDEVNFDYIRFPSDGNLENAAYPFWDGVKPKHKVMREFFAYLREALPDKKISADLFGLVTVATDDMGIGQHLEDALPYFDYISPMVYPSHFASGYEGIKNPAAEPYRVIQTSMSKGLARREAMASATSTPLAKFRPWLQVFDLGAAYTPAMVNAEIKAVNDVFASSTDGYAGWLLWDPANNYTSYKGTAP